MLLQMFDELFDERRISGVMTRMGKKGGEKVN